MSPMQATLKLFRQNGWECEIVEKRVPGKFITKDCFGFGDILAYHAGKKQTALIQCTDHTHGASHRDKILAEKKAVGWLACRNKIFLALFYRRKVKTTSKKAKSPTRIVLEVRAEEIVI